MFGNPMEIALIVGAAVLLFGADKLPKLARSVGKAKQEFTVGQAEADIEAERIRAELRAKRAAADPMPDTSTMVNGVGQVTPPPIPGSGTTTPPSER